MVIVSAGAVSVTVAGELLLATVIVTISGGIVLPTVVTVTVSDPAWMTVTVRGRYYFPAR